MAQKFLKTNKCTSGYTGLEASDAINDNFEELYAGLGGGGGSGGEGTVISGLVNDGTTDNLSAVNTALTNADDGELLIIPAGDYFFSGPINLTSFSKNIRLTVLGDLYFGANQDGIIVGGNTLVSGFNRQIINIYGRLEGNNSGTNYDSYENTSAVTIRNSNGNRVYLAGATHWKNGVKLECTGGTASGTLYNTVVFDILDQNANGVLLVATGNSLNYVNHNYIFGGAVNVGKIGILSTKNTGQVDPFNGNQFFGIGFELMTTYTVDLDFAENNSFYGCRILAGENPAVTDLIRLSNTANKNKFIGSEINIDLVDDSGVLNDFNMSSVIDTGNYSKAFRYDPATNRLGIGEPPGADFPYFIPQATIDARGTIQVRKTVDYDETNSETYLYLGGGNVVSDNGVEKGYGIKVVYTDATTPSKLVVFTYDGFDASNRYQVPTTDLTDILEISGGKLTFNTLKLTGGSPGSGKVLTSDADGDATWQTPSAGGSGSVRDEFTLALNALGSSIKAQTVGFNILSSNASSALTDGQLRLVAVYLPEDSELTGVKWICRTQGNYTADNENRIGLYTHSAGELTLVASSVNDGDVWKAAANTIVSTAFSSPYTATAGIYYVGFLYNQSTQTTAPAVGALGVAMNNALQSTIDFSNGTKLTPTINSQSTLASTPSLSGSGTAVVPFWCALY